MQKNKKLTTAKCPCCKNEVYASEISIISKKAIPFWGRSMIEVNFQLLTSGQITDWACDSCIESSRAIKADIEVQTYCDELPKLAYYDKENVCKRCNEEYIFEKGEQLFWYEKLKFWVQSESIHCKNCRAIIKAQKDRNTRLSTLLKDGIPKSKEELMEIATIYKEMGKIEKATGFFNLANK